MNKQEVIKKIEKEKSGLNAWEDLTRNRALNDALAIVRKLDAPERPVVPQYVADWIEWCKRNKVSLLGGFSAIDELGLAICNDKKVKSLDASKWATQNQETFAKAWLFGYEVEKEKLYTVELPNPNGGTHLVLCKDCDGKLFIETFLIDDWESFGKCKLTEAEIKQDFDWAWQFAKEVKE